MKKTLSMLLAIAMCIVFSVPVYAEQPDEAIVLTYDEINNSSIELQNNCVILTTQPSNSSTSYARSRANFSRDSYSDNTSIVIFTESSADANQIYNELSEIQEESVTIATTRTAWDSGSAGKSASSAVIGIKLTLRVYYKYTTQSGHDWYKFTKAVATNNKSSSSSAVIGSGFSVSSQTLTCGVQGQNLEGLSGAKQFNSTVDIGKNPTSYTYTAPDSWPTVCEDTGILGATYKLTATRSGKTYSVEVTNNIFNNLGG